MQNTDPINIYRQKLEGLNTTEKKFIQRKKLLSWLRGLSILASFLLLWQLWPVSIPIAFAAFIIFFGLFLIIVVKDLKNKDEIENTRILVQINVQEIEILDHHFLTLPDGQNLRPENHPYANDLDIFGRASIYQYVNRTVSEQGNQRFAAWLLDPAEPKIILQRQEAAKELTSQVAWRHQLRAYGLKNPLSLAAEKKVAYWLKTGNRFIDNIYWKITRFLFPAITLTILILFLIGLLSPSIFYPLTIVFFGFAYAVTRIIMPHYLLLNKIVPDLETLQNSIGWIEDAFFKSELLSKLKNDFKTPSSKASTLIKDLKKILERFDYRFNPLIHFPLNTFLLWDLQQIMTLEKWKRDNDQNIETWIHALAEVESIITIAAISFNHPQWCYPSLSDDKGVFIADDLGHPLIPAGKRVNNSFSTKGEKQLNLITGSNMAGKSTFLRS
ncbi:MAG TPA: hypothetical protein VK588_01500, partial [Chitinophagaceae bacterium]|nr:hypothetical protein [Chitinophagaceae bacterium]